MSFDVAAESRRVLGEGESYDRRGLSQQHRFALLSVVVLPPSTEVSLVDRVRNIGASGRGTSIATVLFAVRSRNRSWAEVAVLRSDGSRWSLLATGREAFDRREGRFTSAESHGSFAASQSLSSGTDLSRTHLTFTSEVDRVRIDDQVLDVHPTGHFALGWAARTPPTIELLDQTGTVLVSQSVAERGGFGRRNRPTIWGVRWV